MKAKQPKNKLPRLSSLSSWVLLGLAIFFGVVGVLALRQNNLKALELRDAVLVADKEGQDVEQPLKDLREFTYTHMNANLSSDTSVQHPVQLKYRYERLLKVEKDRVAKANENIYTQAQKYCEARHGSGDLRSGRVPCTQRYIQEHGVSEQQIPDALYKFDFVSPTWSPDLAGISLVLSVIFFAQFISRYAFDRWFKAELKEIL